MSESPAKKARNGVKVRSLTCAFPDDCSLLFAAGILPHHTRASLIDILSKIHRAHRI